MRDIARDDRAGKETRRWTLHGAGIKVLEYDGLEGGNTENVRFLIDKAARSDTITVTFEERHPLPDGHSNCAPTVRQGSK